MKKILILIVVVIVIAIVVLTKFVFPACENEILNTAESKDGKYIATLYSRSCGATTDDYTNIDIKRKNDFFGLKKNILKSEGYNTKINMVWNDRTLSVNYPEDLELLKKITSWNDVKIDYNKISNQQ